MMSALTWIFPPSLQRWLTPDHFQRPPPQRGRSWSVESLLEWQSNSQLSTSPWRNSYQNSWMIKKKHTEKSIHTYTYNIYIYILIRIHFLFGIFQPSCIIGSPAPVKRAGTALYEDLDAWALPAFPPVKFHSFSLEKRTIPKRKVVLKKCPFYRVYVKLWGLKYKNIRMNSIGMRNPPSRMPVTCWSFDLSAKSREMMVTQ